MNYDPRMPQIVPIVALGGNDNIGMNQKKAYIIYARNGHHFLFTHTYGRFAPVLDMSTSKAHKPRPENAPDGSQC